MPEISTAGIIAIISSAFVAVVGAVPLINLVNGMIEARRKRIDEKNKSHLSLSAELAKVDLERDEDEREGIREYIQLLKERCEDCEKKLEIAENSSLISRTKKREINTIMLKINKNMYAMRKGFEEKYHVLELNAIFTSIEKTDRRA